MMISAFILCHSNGEYFLLFMTEYVDWNILVLFLKLIHLLNLHRIFDYPHVDSFFVTDIFGNTTGIISCRVFQSQYRPEETFLIMIIDINNSSTVFYLLRCWEIRCSTERVAYSDSYKK